MTSATVTQRAVESIRPVPSEVAQLAGVTKNYGPNRALDRIDLSVNRGEIVAFASKIRHSWRRCSSECWRGPGCTCAMAGCTR